MKRVLSLIIVCMILCGMSSVSAAGSNSSSNKVKSPAYSTAFIQYCKDFNIPTDKNTPVTVTFYLDKPAKSDLTYAASISAYPEGVPTTCGTYKLGVYKDVLDDIVIPKGKKEVKVTFLVPGNPDIKYYDIKYFVSSTTYAKTYRNSVVKDKDFYISALCDTPITTKAVRIKLPEYKDYIIYNLKDEAFKVTYDKKMTLGKDMPYVITNTSTISLPPYSAIIYDVNNLAEKDMRLAVDAPGNILVTNHTNSTIVFKPGELKGSNPGIKEGKILYYRIAMFKKDFEDSSILGKFPSSSTNLIYAQQWTSGGFVPAGPTGSQSTTSTVSGSNWLKDIAKSSFSNTNMLGQGAVVEKDGYYYTTESDNNYNYCLVKIKISDGSKKVLAKDTTAFLMRISDEYLYYQGNNSDFCRIDLKTDKREILVPGNSFTGGINGWMYVTENGIFYQSTYQYKLRKLDPVTLKSSVVELCQGEVQDPNVVGNYIYYRNSADQNKIYRYDMIKNTSEKLSDMQISYNMIYDGNYLYFNGQDMTDYSQWVFRVNLNGGDIKKIYSGCLDNFWVEKGTIYAWKTNDGVYKIDENGTETKISDRPMVSSVIVTDNNIYIIGMSSEFTDIISKK